MKKTATRLTFALACSLALASLMAFTGCSGNSGSYDSETQDFDPAFQNSSPTESSEMDENENTPSENETTTARARDAYDATIGQDKVMLTDAQWRAILSNDEYRILRQSGTERGGTGRYLNNDDPGAYHCAGCGQRLYDAKNKFHSTCGWPAFNSEVADGALTYIEDTSAGMLRTEMRCSRCDGHLGHVFDDGRLHGQDLPTRHCVNGGAVIFIPENEDVQEVIRHHRADFAGR